GDGAPMGASCSSCAPSHRRCGASRRAIAASIRRRAALSDVPFHLAFGSKLAAPFGSTASSEPRASRNGPPSASSWQGTLVSPGGAPAPPGCRRSVRLLPAGAASDPTLTTPHDSALGGLDRSCIYSYRN